jgi:F0F1-type ATP synthase assembly protein I
MENNTPKIFYALSLAAELGFLIAAPLIIFLLLGLYLDRKFGTMPLFIIIALLLNLIVTFFEVKNLILPFLEKRSKSVSGDNSRGESDYKKN